MLLLTNHVTLSQFLDLSLYILVCEAAMGLTVSLHEVVCRLDWASSVPGTVSAQSRLGAMV